MQHKKGGRKQTSASQSDSAFVSPQRASSSTSQCRNNLAATHAEAHMEVDMEVEVEVEDQLREDMPRACMQHPLDPESPCQLEVVTEGVQA